MSEAEGGAAAANVSRWSAELARDPRSRAFLPLGDALRRQGDLELAHRVALRGLERYPYDADAHDLLARVAADRGDWERASDEWGMALRIAPQHPGALKGAGFVHFRAGRLAEAEAALAAAARADRAAASALAHVRAARTAPPPRAGAPHARGTPGATEARALFAETVSGADEQVLLLDVDGLVIAGAFRSHGGRDVGDDVGAQLTGVSDEATRAMRHLGLGEWTSISIETDAAVVTIAPASRGALLLVAASAAAPLGHVRRLVARAMERARRWLSDVP